MTALPRLELAERQSDFDETVITIDGSDADIITIELQLGSSLEFADRLIRYVNAQEQVIKALTAAAHALRSCEYGNASPDLARDIAAHCDVVKAEMGSAA